ncbi:MAG: ABC transporter ATP-binding protein/permease, partial [Anaeroplasmataceae bacterium]|nr:ABC transporter ATP-binding protein/permease [Anaeroplasmataceae bacterium]
VMMFFMYASLTIVSFFSAYLIVTTNKTELGIENISAVITYGTQILMSLMMLSMIFVMLSLSISSMRRVVEVLKEESTIKNPEDPIYEIEDGSIEFKDVSFKYSLDAEKYALADVNLKIESGQTIGILGGTGSSKTTFVNLLSRLYDTTVGEVIVGGKNVKEYDLKTLRDNVAVVLQKNVLFSGTILENLRWGNENATLEEAKEACRLACASEFVEQFPEKYDTYIEQGGTNVSGGQKQRLCIARALLKKPKVLILDDSTSAVDTKTDAIIRKSFKESIPNTTKIIIAQRVSSIESADKIIVLDGGRINAVGTHEELLKNNAIYQEVYYLQNKKEEE